MSDRPVTLDRAALTADQAAAIPPIASGYTLTASPDGRVYLHHQVGEADWYCIPRAWRDLRYRPESGEIGAMQEVSENYGVDVDALHQRPGTIQTNDASLRPEALLATTATPAEQCPLPPPDAGNTIGLVVVLVMVTITALLFGRRRP